MKAENRRGKRLGAAALALGFAMLGGPLCGGAFAQNAGNEVWLGQTGLTNTITITQEGEGNSAGADNSRFLINQDGSENSLELDQFGYDNKLGATDLGAGRPTGINQIGSRNLFDIAQRNAASGFNVIGAVFQTSFDLLQVLANSLTIRQNEFGGLDGAAGHYVGSVRQNNASNGLAANTAAITQTEGGAGLGNRVDRVYQDGHGNALDLFQGGQSSVVNDMQQIGQDNRAFVDQQAGEGNRLEALQQYGNANRATVVHSGDGSATLQLLQNNDILAGGGIGNRAEVTLVGRDNGGTGIGGEAGGFQIIGAGELPGVGQAVLAQLGDDNDIRLTVLQGDLTRYGITQFGDGNGVIATVAALAPASLARRNELAIFQDGLDNALRLEVIGDDNSTVSTQAGDRNRFDVFQSGLLNAVRIATTGTDNNAPTAGGLAGPALLLAQDAGLGVGRIVQNGLLHRLSVGIEGSYNQIAASQEGQAHRIEGFISGSYNHVVAVQTGTGNTSLSEQTGSGNVLGVRQR